MLYYTRDGRTLTGTVLELGAGVVTPNDRAREIVTSLLEGKGAMGLRPTLPAETKLRSIFVTNGLAVVNLSREFVNNFQGGPDQELVAVYSLVNSLLFNIEGIDGIQILVEGERLPTLRGTVDIEQPLVANQAITRSL
jgi:spore germination protein GerM